MHTTLSLANKLAKAYPNLTFTQGEHAHWSPDKQTVYYSLRESHAAWVLLHEAAHGLLGHTNYNRDIELLTIERDAWQYAAHTLAPQFNLSIDPEFVETQLDTYRDWLHAKSTCTTCQSNGIEHAKHRYQCLHCGSTWRVNTGIDVHIRRFATA